MYHSTVYPYLENIFEMHIPSVSQDRASKLLKKPASFSFPIFHLPFFCFLCSNVAFFKIIDVTQVAINHNNV